MMRNKFSVTKKTNGTLHCIIKSIVGEEYGFIFSPEEAEDLVKNLCIALDTPKKKEEIEEMNETEIQIHSAVCDDGTINLTMDNSYVFNLSLGNAEELSDKVRDSISLIRAGEEEAKYQSLPKVVASAKPFQKHVMVVVDEGKDRFAFNLTKEDAENLMTDIIFSLDMIDPIDINQESLDRVRKNIKKEISSSDRNFLNADMSLSGDQLVLSYTTDGPYGPIKSSLTFNNEQLDLFTEKLLAAKRILVANKKVR